MKIFTLLAITGGLFFTSLCLDLDNKSEKSNSICAKSSVKHTVKKCCPNAKMPKCASVNIGRKAACVRG
jgi:hypothetical protein